MKASIAQWVKMYRCSNWQNRTMAGTTSGSREQLLMSFLNNNPSARCYFQRMLDQSYQWNHRRLHLNLFQSPTIPRTGYTHRLWKNWYVCLCVQRLEEYTKSNKKQQQSRSHHHRLRRSTLLVLCFYVCVAVHCNTYPLLSPSPSPPLPKRRCHTYRRTIHIRRGVIIEILEPAL